MKIDSFEYEADLAKKSLTYVMNKIKNQDEDNLGKWIDLDRIFISKDINEETSYVKLKVKENSETSSHSNFEINKSGDLILISPISFINGEKISIDPNIVSKFILDIENV